MRPRATPRFALGLALVSVVAILYISFATIGQGHQGRVEDRIASIVELAEHLDVPVPALMALCVTDSHRDPPRPDAELARILVRALEAEGGDVGKAIRHGYADEVTRRLAVDLWGMNRKRWSRMAAQCQDS